MIGHSDLPEHRRLSCERLVSGEHFGRVDVRFGPGAACPGSATPESRAMAAAEPKPARVERQLRARAGVSSADALIALTGERRTDH